MKTSNFLFFILLIVILCSCGNDPKSAAINKLYPPIDTIETLANGEKVIKIYEVDSCEYIGNIRGNYEDFLTHKGNCKYCIERNKN